MPITLGNNIASLRAQRKLSEHTEALSRVQERLSSGLRINRASDDAAGLAISESLKADSKIYSQAIRNVNDGISMLSIVDSALASLQGIVERQRELSTQAANGVYSATQRRALNTELQSLTKEYNRIVQSTEFNDISLLQNPGQVITLQAGKDHASTLQIALGTQLARTVGTGSFASYSSFASGGFPLGTTTADFNNNGKMDFAVANSVSNSISIHSGNGNGTFIAGTSYQTGVSGPQDVTAIDINGDSYVDLLAAGTGGFGVLINNGNGTFKAAVTYSSGTTPNEITAEDINADGIIDVITADNATPSMTVFLGLGNGSFGSGTASSIGTQPSQVAVGDINSDGRADAIVADHFNGIYIRLGNGDGSFTSDARYQITSPVSGASAVQLSDFNGDGYLDIATAQFIDDTVAILLNNGNGSFTAARTIAVQANPVGIELGDLNGDGLDDIIIGGDIGIQTLINDGFGSFGNPITTAGLRQYRPSTADFNGDGVLDVTAAQSSANNASVYIASTTLSNLEPYQVLYTQADALESMSFYEQQQQRIILERGQISAFQSRLDVTLHYLAATVEVTESAGSRIRDADIAQESAELVRRQILQQSATAILAQANIQPSLALKLL